MTNGDDEQNTPDRGERDTTTRYTSTDGEELSFSQIAFAAAKDPNVTVEETADGYRVDGTLFTPADG